MVECYVDPEGSSLPLFNLSKWTGVQFGVNKDHPLHGEGKETLVKNTENRVGYSDIEKRESL